MILHHTRTKGGEAQASPFSHAITAPLPHSELLRLLWEYFSQASGRNRDILAKELEAHGWIRRRRQHR